MPFLIVLLSVLGLVPFIVCGLAALGPDAATAQRMLSALIAYAAVALALIGGVHWGLALRTPVPEESRFAERARLGFGAAAVVVGWIALLLPLVAASWLALVVLLAGHIGAVVAEHALGRRGLLPPRYLWLRWGYTVVAAAMLITVLTLSLFGRTVQVF